MKWRRMPAGPIQANAYFLVSEDQSCLIFDPGGEADKINNYIKENNLKPLAILLTHAHFDHIGALDEVRDRWDVPVYLHKNEEKWLEDSSLNGSGILRGIAVTARPSRTAHRRRRHFGHRAFPFGDIVYAGTFTGKRFLLCEGRGSGDFR